MALDPITAGIEAITAGAQLITLVGGIIARHSSAGTTPSSDEAALLISLHKQAADYKLQLDLAKTADDEADADFNKASDE